VTDVAPNRSPVDDQVTWQLVERWARNVKADPGHHLGLVQAALAAKPRDQRLRSNLHRVAGLAALDLGRATEARAHARQAVRAAGRSGDAPLEGLARTLLARVLAYCGSLDAALLEADRAQPLLLLDGEALGGLHVQRTMILYKLGRLSDAFEACSQGIALLQHGDPAELGKALNNRGALQLYLGDYGAGYNDLEAAERLLAEVGLVLGEAGARHNRGMMLARLGDIPAALAAFDRSEQQMRQLGVPIDVQVLAKAELLLAARLTYELRQTVRQAVESLERSGMLADAAEGRLLLAQALALDGDRAAIVEAGQAARDLARSRRWGWAALARYSAAAARYLHEGPSTGLLRAAKRSATALSGAGLVLYEPEAWLLIGRIAADLGRTAEARDYLALASRSRRASTALHRAVGWEAEARTRLLLGRASGALRAADTGLRVLEQHRAALGATDLRAHASGHGTGLAEVGVGLAWDRRRAADLLRWAERLRARTLSLRPVRPPEDKELATLLAELRRASAALRDAQLGHRASTDDERRLADVEASLRDYARGHGHEPDAQRAPDQLDLVSLMGALGCRALVELVDHRGRLGAVVVVDGRCRFAELGPLTPALQYLDSLSFGLQRLTRFRRAGRESAATVATTNRALDQLRGQLVVPISRWIEGRDLVIVPTAAFHSLPWDGLAGHLATSVTVAPSSSLWTQAQQHLSPTGPVALAAGPDLVGAKEEIGRIEKLYEQRRVLDGEHATVEALQQALDGARIAHIAAHGHVRADNPLLSSLRLADGPVTVYDLERLGQAPGVMVLSACNSGVSAVRAGNELLGLSAALLSLGSRTVIASVVPLPDSEVIDFMESLHRGLAAGTAPARALRAARARLDNLGPDGQNPAAYAASLAIQCLGVG
jgi:tetratricopeptide (TPR) repeat protein